MFNLSINRIFVLFEFCMIISIMQNLLCWIDLGTLFYSGLITFSLVLCMLFYQKWCLNELVYPGMVLVLITSLFVDQVLYTDGPIPAITKGVIFALGIGLFSLKWEYKQRLLKTVTDFFGILLFLSVSLYLVFLVVDIPPYGILSTPYGYEDHSNYILFILPCNYFIPRFSGPFIEPGHLAIFCCFILYANKFCFKSNKLLYVYIFAIFISLSLAGYVLLLSAYILFVRIKLKTVFVSILLGILIVLGVTQVWNEGDNPIYELIFKRLEYDDNKGIAGNNRTMYGTDEYFKRYIGSNDSLIGIGAKKYGEMQKNNIIGGAGCKVFIIQYGIIGTLLIFLFYLVIASCSTEKKYTYRFLLLLVICFLQRSYPEWIAWLLPYTCSFNCSNGTVVRRLIANTRTK